MIPLDKIDEREPSRSRLQPHGGRLLPPGELGRSLRHGHAVCLSCSKKQGMPPSNYHVLHQMSRAAAASATMPGSRVENRRV